MDRERGMRGWSNGNGLQHNPPRLPHATHGANTANPPNGSMAISLEDFVLDDSVDLNFWNDILNDVNHATPQPNQQAGQHGVLLPYPAAGSGAHPDGFDVPIAHTFARTTAASDHKDPLKTSKPPDDKKKTTSSNNNTKKKSTKKRMIKKKKKKQQQQQRNHQDKTGTKTAGATKPAALAAPSAISSEIHINSAVNKAIVPGLELSIESHFFGCYWRNGNHSILAFPHVRGKPHTDYLTMLDDPNLQHNCRKTSDVVRLRVKLPPHLDRSKVSFVGRITLANEVFDPRDIVGVNASRNAALELSKSAASSAVAVMPDLVAKEKMTKVASASAGEVVDMRPRKHFAWKFTGSVGSHRGKQNLTNAPFMTVDEAKKHKYALTFSVRAYYNRDLYDGEKEKKGKGKGAAWNIRNSVAAAAPGEKGGAGATTKIPEKWFCIGAVQSPAFMIGSTRNLKMREAPARKNKRGAPSETDQAAQIAGTAGASGNGQTKRHKKSLDAKKTLVSSLEESASSSPASSSSSSSSFSGMSLVNPLDGLTNNGKGSSPITSTSSTSTGSSAREPPADVHADAGLVAEQLNFVQPQDKRAEGSQSERPCAPMMAGNIAIHRRGDLMAMGRFNEATALLEDGKPKAPSDSSVADKARRSEGGGTVHTPNHALNTVLGAALAQESTHSRATSTDTIVSTSTIESHDLLSYKNFVNDEDGCNDENLDAQRGYYECKLCDLEVGDFTLGEFVPVEMAPKKKAQKAQKTSLWAYMRDLFVSKKKSAKTSTKQTKPRGGL